METHEQRILLFLFSIIFQHWALWLVGTDTSPETPSAPLSVVAFSLFQHPTILSLVILIFSLSRKKKHFFILQKCCHDPKLFRAIFCLSSLTLKASFLWLSILETCCKFLEINVNPFARLGSRLLDGREISQESFLVDTNDIFIFGGYMCRYRCCSMEWKEEEKNSISLIEFPKNRTVGRSGRVLPST